MKRRATTTSPEILTPASADAGSSSDAVGTVDHSAAPVQAGIEQVNRFINAMSRNARPL